MKRPSRKKYESLLDTATALFLEQGYQQVSIARLLERAGGSRETIYRHFKNKDDLFAAVIDRQLQDYRETMSGIQVEADDLRLGLLELAKATIRVVTSERYVQLRRLVITESTLRPQVGELYFERTFLAGCRGWEAFMAHQVSLRNLKKLDPATLTDYLIGMLLYRISLQRLLNIRKALGPRQIQQLAERVVDDFILGFGNL